MRFSRYPDNEILNLREAYFSICETTTSYEKLYTQFKQVENYNDFGHLFPAKRNDIKTTFILVDPGYPRGGANLKKGGANLLFGELLVQIFTINLPLFWTMTTVLTIFNVLRNRLWNIHTRKQKIYRNHCFTKHRDLLKFQLITWVYFLFWNRSKNIVRVLFRNFNYL